MLLINSVILAYRYFKASYVGIKDVCDFKETWLITESHSKIV